jgi:hypothetical protein
MLCTFDRAMKEARAMPERLGRRRENRVVGCLACGAVLGIYIEGEVPKTEAHACPFERDLYEPEEIREEMQVGREEDA